MENPREFILHFDEASDKPSVECATDCFIYNMEKVHVIEKSAYDKLKEENERLKEEMEAAFILIGDDGPELSCPFIDGVINRFPETKNTMERIRTINTQLRYNLNATTEINNDINKENELLKKENATLKDSLGYTRMVDDRDKLIFELMSKLADKELLKKMIESGE